MDFATLVKLLIILAIVILPAINRMLATVREQRKAMQGPVRPTPRPDQGSEIEEFLRRANRGPGDASARRPAAATPVLASRKTASPIQAEVVDDNAVSGRVAEHVKSYLDASEFKRRTASLADDMAQADEKRVEHLQEVFGHQVGQLSESAASAALPPQSAQAEESAVAGVAALDLGALLAQPENLRQAILIQELLQRPEHRWE